jgi:hypothetical protein
MFQKFLAIARIPAGIILILLGVAAFFTPLTPGSWLAVIGLEFLGVRVAYGPYLKAARRKIREWRQARKEIS